MSLKQDWPLPFIVPSFADPRSHRAFRFPGLRVLRQCTFVRRSKEPPSVPVSRFTGPPAMYLRSPIQGATERSGFPVYGSSGNVPSFADPGATKTCTSTFFSLAGLLRHFTPETASSDIVAYLPQPVCMYSIPALSLFLHVFVYVLICVYIYIYTCT
jgi:hypothetical protein